MRIFKIGLDFLVISFGNSVWKLETSPRKHVAKRNKWFRYERIPPHC